MLYIAEVVAIIEEAKKRGEHSYTFINLSSYVRHILMKVGYKIRFSIDENWNGVYKVDELYIKTEKWAFMPILNGDRYC